MKANGPHLREPLRIGQGIRPNECNRKDNKIRITIHLDNDVISYFRNRASETAKGYQTLINEALREYTGLENRSGVTTDLVDRVKRLEEELLGSSSE